MQDSGDLRRCHGATCGGHLQCPRPRGSRPNAGRRCWGPHLSWWVTESGFSRCRHKQWPPQASGGEPRRPRAAAPTDLVIGSRGVQEGLRPLPAVGTVGPSVVRPRDTAGEGTVRDSGQKQR